jgi:uncharacterized protein YndB with AHSA1/START domain
MTFNIHLEKVIEADAQDVWRALTQPELIARWLMKNDFDAREGHSFTFRDKPRGNWDGIVRCRVIELNEPRRLTYTWSGASPKLETTVTWLVQSESGGTKVSLSHRGFQGLKGFFIGRLLKSGWTDMLNRGLPAAAKDQKLLRASRSRGVSKREEECSGAQR